MNNLRETVSQMVQDVCDGNESACKAHAILKGVEATIKAGLNVIQSEAIIEAHEFDKGETYYGGTWQLKSTPTYLDFTKDETYQILYDKARSRKADLNAAYKAKQSGKGFFDSETGEEMPILPVKTPAKEIVVFKEK